jgi:hypothetical protein
LEFHSGRLVTVLESQFQMEEFLEVLSIAKNAKFLLDGDGCLIIGWVGRDNRIVELKVRPAAIGISYPA